MCGTLNKSAIRNHRIIKGICGNEVFIWLSVIKMEKKLFVQNNTRQIMKSLKRFACELTITVFECVESFIALSVFELRDLRSYFSRQFYNIF